MGKKRRKKPRKPGDPQPDKKTRDEELREGPDEETHTENSGEQTFFAFSGELRSLIPLYLPDATQTDPFGGLEKPEEPAPETPPSAAEDPETETEDEHEISEAGPVRGDDLAASTQSASQSQEAAGPAHFTDEQDVTQTDLAPAAGPPAVDEGAAPPITPTEQLRARLKKPAPAPEPTAPADRAPVEIGDGADADEATHTEVFRLEPEEPIERPAEEAQAPEAAAPVEAEEEEAPPTRTEIFKPGTEDLAAGTRRSAEEAQAPEAAAPVEAEEEEAPPTRTEIFKPETKDLAAEVTRTSDLAEERAYAEAGPDEETRTQEHAEEADQAVALPPEAADPDATVTHAGEAEAPTPLEDPDATATHPGPLEEIDADRTATQADPDRTATHGGPAAAPDRPAAFVDLDAATDPRPEAGEFTAGPIFDAPAPASEPSAAGSDDDLPQLRSRGRRHRLERPGLLRRVYAGARAHFKPRDFLEIVAKAAFAKAFAWTDRFRKERRQQRVSQNAQWWRRTLVELAVLYAIVVPIELAANRGQIGSFGIHPHPYWLIVLPMAAARGLVAGFLAAAIASLLYAIGAWRGLDAGDAIFTYRNMTEPILFFAVAFFAGELHDERELKRRKLKKRLDDMDERTTRLRQQRDVLQDANKELEKRIVDDSVQFGNLILAAKRIERAGRQEVFELALELVEEHCGAHASVLMLLEDRSLDFLCHRGWPDEELGYRLAVARGSAFVKRAIAEGIAVNGFDPEETVPHEGPLVVAPLFDAGGVVKALMCLDHVPMARLNESTVTVFLGIAEWASAALARLARGADAPAPRTQGMGAGSDMDIWLGTKADLGRRLRLELARSSRYGVPTSFLAIQATQWTDTSREGQDAIDRFILVHFTTGLRPSDGIYRFGYPGCYLLVLAGTGLEGAEVVRTRLLRRVEYSPAQVGTIEITATAPDVEAPDLVSLAERVADGFRNRSALPLEGKCPIEVPEKAETGDLTAFLRRLKLETSLAVRNGFDLHVVGLSAELTEQAEAGLLARHVMEAGAQTLRPTDGVYTIGQYHVAVILPCTNGEEAATVAHRLATLVRSRDPHAPYGNLETQVLGLGTSNPDAGSFLTALARRTPRGVS